MFILQNKYDIMLPQEVTPVNNTKNKRPNLAVYPRAAYKLAIIQNKQYWDTIESSISTKSRDWFLKAFLYFEIMILNLFTNINMYISNQKYRLAELNEHNLQESARLLAKTFLSFNKVWLTIKPTPEEISKFMYDKTKQMLEWQQEVRDEGVIPKDAFLNFVYLDSKDRIIGVWTGFELMQYLNKNSKVDLPQFNTLQTYGKELQKSIDPQDLVPGRSTYGMFSTVDTDYMSSGMARLFWFDALHYLHSIGFKTAYGRCSNVKSYSLIVKNGGTMTSKIKVIENDKIMTLSFVKWDCLPIAINRQKLKANPIKASL